MPLEYVTSLEGAPLLKKAREVPPWQFPPWLAAGKLFVRYTDNYNFLARGASGLFSSIIRMELDEACYFVMLEPDPEEYEAAYGALPILRFAPFVTDDEFWSKTTFDPIGGPVGITMYGEVMVMFGEKASWLVYYKRSRSMAMLVTSFNPDTLIEVTPNWWYPFDLVRENVPSNIPVFYEQGPIYVR